MLTPQIEADWRGLKHSLTNTSRRITTSPLALLPIRWNRLLIGGDFRLFLQRDTDLIETVDQFMFPGSIDCKEMLLPATITHCLGKSMLIFSEAGSEAILANIQWQLDGQQPVFGGIHIENITEAASNHGFKAVIQQRPCRVLSRRARTKIITSDEDLSGLICWIIQDKCWIRLALRQIAPIIK